jgi:ribose transport system permease protein
MTWSEQFPVGAAGGRQLAGIIRREAPPGASMLIVVGNTAIDAAFADALSKDVSTAGFEVLGTVRGQPTDIRRALVAHSEAGRRIDVVAASDVTARWSVLHDRQLAATRDSRLLFPSSYYWPNFLKLGNLLNIANQIAFIAIIAIGMTMVIIAGGIDLSVGSLVALSSVVAARLIRDAAGGDSSGLALGACCLVAIGVCAAAGAISGLAVTRFRIPAFIATLAMMSIASGLAFIVSEDKTIGGVPLSLQWLTRGAPLGVPNSIVLMLLLYAVAHVVMSRTVLGRYLYAVGGNRQAAFLCGLPVARVELTSYIVSGALAGLAGVLMVSEYRSGVPTFGVTYELQVIAAVVVGGTSLAGGSGRMFGTLLGALLIAVVSNGMNLMGIPSNPQKVVLGLVILAAAVLDRVKQGRGD